MCKVGNRSTKRKWGICPKLAIKTPKRCHWPRSDVFIVNFTYFTCYSSVSVVDLEQVNVSLEPVLLISIYPRAENVIPLQSILLILNIFHTLLRCILILSFFRIWKRFPWKISLPSQNKMCLLQTLMQILIS